MKRVFVHIMLLFLFLSHAAYSQDKKLEEKMKTEANQLFEKEDYIKAFPLYSRLLSIYPKNPFFNYRFGVCALYSDRSDPEKPIQYLEFASKNYVEPDVFYYLGLAYHNNYRFDEAIRQYEIYKKNVANKTIKKLDVDRQIEMCNNGLELLNSINDLYVLEKKEVKLNNFYRSYSVSEFGGMFLVKPDEFISKIDENKEKNGIIFFSDTNEVICFSSYGKTGKDGKDIYMCKDGVWSDPILLSPVINTPYDEDYPYLLPDGKTLYFSSKGHNSMGGYDIFKSVYDSVNGEWTPPVNLDFPVNTPFDDILFVTDSAQQNACFSSNRNSISDNITFYKVRIDKRPPVSEQITLNINYNFDTTKTFNTEYKKSIDLLNEKSDLQVNATPEMFEDKKTQQKQKVDLNEIDYSLVNLKNQEIVEKGFNQLDRTKKQLQELNVKKYSTYAIANERKKQADTKSGESKKILANSNNITDKETKLLEQAKAEKTKKESRQLYKESTVAYIVGQRLDKQIEQKEKEIQRNVKYSAEIQRLVAIQSVDSALLLLNIMLEEAVFADTLINLTDMLDEQLQQLSKESEKYNAKGKEAEYDIVSLQQEVNNMERDLKKTKNEQYRQDYQQQISEINKEIESKKAEAEEAYAKAKEIQYEVDSVQLNDNFAENTSNDIENYGKANETKLLSDYNKTYADKYQVHKTNTNYEKQEKEIAEYKKPETEKNYSETEQQNVTSDKEKQTGQIADNQITPVKEYETIEDISDEEITEIKSNEQVQEQPKQQSIYEKEIISEAHKQAEILDEDVNKLNLYVAASLTISDEKNNQYQDKQKQIEQETNPDKIKQLQKESADLAREAVAAYNISEQLKVKLEKKKNDAADAKGKVIKIENLINSSSSTQANTELNKLKSDIQKNKRTGNINDEISESIKNETAASENQPEYTNKILAQIEQKSSQKNITSTAVDEPRLKNQIEAIQEDNAFTETYTEKSTQKETASQEKVTQQTNANDIIADAHKQVDIIEEENKKAKEYSEIALNISVQKNKLYEETINKIKQEKDPKKVADLKVKSEQLAREAFVSYQLYEITANKAKETEEKLVSIKNDVVSIEKLTENNSIAEAQQKLENIKKQTDEANVNITEQIYPELKNEADEKQKSANDELMQADNLNNEAKQLSAQIDELKTEIKNKNKNSKEVQQVQKQINELESTVKDNKKQAEIHNSNAAKLKKEADALKMQADYTSGILSQIDKEIASGNNEKYSVNSINKTELVIKINSYEANKPFTEYSPLVIPQQEITQQKTETAQQETEAQKFQQMGTEKQIKSLEVYGQANQKSYEYNKTKIADYKSADVKNSNYDASEIAKLMEQAKKLEEEAESYFNKAKELREKANSTENSETKKALLEEAKSYEDQALAKQNEQIVKYQQITGITTEPELAANNSNNSNTKAVTQEKVTTNQTVKTNDAGKQKEAAQMEQVAMDKKIKSLETYGQANQKSYGLNKGKIEQLKTTGNSSNLSKDEIAKLLEQAKKLEEESQSYFNKAKNLREKALSATDYQIKKSMLEQAQSFENMALNKQNEIVKIYQDKGITTSDNIIAGTSNNIVIGNKEENKTEKPNTNISYAPTESKVYKDLIFKVQIGAFKNPIPQDLFNGIRPVTGEKTPAGITRYMAGIFDDIRYANEARDKIREIGYKDAFVVAFYNGKRMDADEALAMINNGKAKVNNEAAENLHIDLNKISKKTETEGEGVIHELSAASGLFYSIQVGCFGKEVNDSTFFGIIPIYKEKNASGNTKYLAGLFVNIEEVNKTLNKIKNMGYNDAFVVAVYNGKKISTGEALQMLNSGQATMGDIKFAIGVKVTPRTGVEKTTEEEKIIPETNNVENIKGLFYSVQVGVYSAPVNPEQLNVDSVYTEKSDNGNYRYLSGIYTKATGAINAKNKIIEKGIKDAFVVAYLDGKKISLNEARKYQDLGIQPLTNKQTATTEDNKNIIYKVQIGAFRYDIPIEILDLYVKILKDNIEHYVNEQGLTIYTTGTFSDYKSAAEFKQTLNNQGLTDAFVVAFQNGKKITLK